MATCRMDGCQLSGSRPYFSMGIEDDMLQLSTYTDEQHKKVPVTPVHAHLLGVRSYIINLSE